MEYLQTKKYGLVYTEELGWIDLGHAQGQDARILKENWSKNIFNILMNFMVEVFSCWLSSEMEFGKNIRVDLTFHTGVYTKVMVRQYLHHS